eukprot:6189398-Pleurochrysis_carterae.AAC.2
MQGEHSQSARGVRPASQRELASDSIALAKSRAGRLYEEKPRVKKAEKACRGSTKGKELQEKARSDVTRRRKSPKVRKGRKLADGSLGGGEKWGRESETENKGARRRRRRVRRRSCGDDECASGWQTYSDFLKRPRRHC